jgi:hypothetical protein
MSSTAWDPASAQTIVLIHGMWMTPLSWEHWSSRYSDLPAHPFGGPTVLIQVGD